MSLRYVLFRDNSSSHDEEYLARKPNGDFHSVDSPAATNLQFETAAEGYEFAGQFSGLGYWRVGSR